jgi:hypothetical protein
LSKSGYWKTQVKKTHTHKHTNSFSHFEILFSANRKFSQEKKHKKKKKKKKKNALLLHHQHHDHDHLDHVIIMSAADASW